MSLRDDYRRAVYSQTIWRSSTPWTITEHIYNADEIIIYDLYHRILAPGDLAIDGGSCYGLHLFQMGGIVGETGSVVGFEANPELIDNLHSRVREFGLTNVKIVGKALSDRIGTAVFNLRRNAVGQSGLRSPLVSSPTHDDTVEIDVETTTLDHEFPNQVFRFLKLDLEDGEYMALSGGKNLITRSRNPIVIENSLSNTADKHGYTRDDFFELLNSTGYGLWDFSGIPVKYDDWYTDKFLWYFIAMPDNEETVAFVANDLVGLVRSALARLEPFPGIERVFIDDRPLPDAGQNIALNKPAKQSSSYPGTTTDAQGGVDGIVSGKYGFHTDLEDQPWWQVDLQGIYRIMEIRIYNRGDGCQERAYNLVVLFSKDETNWREVHDQNGRFFGAPLAKSRVLRVFPDGEEARFVRVQLTDRQYLHLDEIEIFCSTVNGNPD